MALSLLILNAPKPAGLLGSHYCSIGQGPRRIPAARSALRKARSDDILLTRGMAFCGPLVTPKGSQKLSGLPVTFLINEWFGDLD